MKESETKYMDTEVICACGNKFSVRSTKKEIHVEICNKCHPFYTGKKTLSAKTGNVEKFKAKLAKAEKN